MYLKLRYIHSNDIPVQLKSPEYFLNQKDNRFLNQTEEVAFANLGDIKKINFLVGANNSGKSRFLRSIFNTEYPNLEVFEKKAVSDIVKDLTSNKISNNYKKDTPEKIHANFIYQNIYQDVLNKLNFIDNNNIVYNLVVNYSSNISFFTKAMEVISKRNTSNDTIELDHLLEKFLTELKLLDSELKLWHAHRCKNKIYIPPLRSLFKCEDLSEISLSNLALQHLDLKTSSSDEIYVGLTLYERIKKLKFSRNSESVKQFENFLAKNFFNASKIELIPDEEKSKLLLLKIDNQDHRGLNEIGDGIQAIILLLYPIFTATNNSWFFIEEPETHMHPGFQRIFLETIMNDKHIQEKDLKFFFTSHSNHFLDISIQNDDISIFQFKKIEEGRHLITSNVKPSRTVLDVLGVNTSSVFLANTSLWVEGPTDRKYLSKFLKLYCESKKINFLKEDIDFAFFEYGGSLITHYLFDNVNITEDESVVREKIKSFALSSKIYLLSDSDNASAEEEKAKRRNFLEEISSKEESNFKYQNTVVKEIENLLPADTLKSFMYTLLKNKEDGEILKMVNFNQEDYKEDGIGHFLKGQFKIASINEDSIFKFYVKSASGTLETTYKNKLCRHFIESTVTYEKLIENNPVLEKIIEDLYDFINK
jgi:AAA15 family ATPase/GTPase